MNKILTLIMLFAFYGISLSQSVSNMQMLGSANEYTAGGTPGGWHYAACWGYVANGREYAIIGHYAGTTVYDVTNPDNIINKGTVAGPGSFYNYREMKTYSHYLYIVSEGGSGVQIVDLQYLPDSIHFVKNYTFTGYTRSHSISQDGRFLYSNGGNYNNGGVFILDLLDPENPVKRGQWGTRYVHDCFIKNDTIYAASINQGFMVFLDATNKDSIKFIREFTYPSAVTHNAWTTDDRNILVTTDEGGTNHAILWDISDFSNQVRLSEIIPYDSASMVHNAYIKGDSLYLSHYRAGVIVYDISNPSLPVEVGHYDTYPGTNSTAYQGCWNVYPYLPSGNIIASDISTGLYVLKVGNTTSINNNSTEIADNYTLSQNYPNPFNPLTNITYYLPNQEFVKITVTDELGRQVRTLVNEVQQKGSYSAEFKADGLSSGVYFYTINAGNFVSTKKMILTK
ncbi:MAG TPA: choice-of-anchor B family protein [Ignavibacteria bacterium]|nr:choice-of-anchor B family protein [Ignavibacteria bacterium]